MAVSWSSLRGDSETKKIPDWVFRSNANFISGLLAGYYDADGTTDEWRITTKSKDLAEGTRHLLNLFGYFPSILKSGIYYLVKLDREQWDGGLWEKTGKNPPCRARGGVSIPWSTQMQERLQSSTPTMTRAELKEARQHLDILNRGSRPLRNQSQYMKYVQKFGEVRWLKELFEDYYFSQVEEVLDGGMVDLYDLEVPTTHAFVANGVVCHNTTTLVSIAYNGCWLS